jgi:hypothetical protein
MTDSGGALNASLISSAWTVPTGITMLANSMSPITATIRLSGGTAGQTYRVTCTADQVSGRQQVADLVVSVIAA